MAVVREDPYASFPFQVDLGAGDPDSPDAGFSEVRLPDGIIEVIRYRNGNEKRSAVRKLPGLTAYSNLMLKRGLAGTTTLYRWWDSVRNGDQGARRTVVVRLMSEDRSAVIFTWKFLRAFPVRISNGTLTGSESGVAVEELEIAFEHMECE